MEMVQITGLEFAQMLAWVIRNDGPVEVPRISPPHMRVRVSEDDPELLEYFDEISGAVYFNETNLQYRARADVHADWQQSMEAA